MSTMADIGKLSKSSKFHAGWIWGAREHSKKLPELCSGVTTELWCS